MAAIQVLRSAGWLRRMASGQPSPDRLLRVLATLSTEGPTDRRVLAERSTGDPHALDAGPLASAVLATLSATGRIPAGLPPRAAWAAAGVGYDDLTGGPTMVGIAPAGWTLPPGTPVTVPPRVLARTAWPAGAGSVFVTENPSVLSACLTVRGARAICTSGTPAPEELAAFAALAAAGWDLAVRADFDDSGLRHVNALLAVAPRASAWRMGTADYRAGLDGAVEPLRVQLLVDTPWDHGLRPAMAAAGVAVYEETLLPSLLSDVRSEAML